MPKIETPYKVSCYDGDDANGVAMVLSVWLSQHFESHPSRAKIARRIPRPVTVYSTDTGATATLVFGRDEAVIYNDLVGRPGVTIKATVDQITDVSQLKVIGAGFIPVGFFTKRGLSVLGQIASRRLIVKGLFTHTVSVLHFVALVSVAQ